MKVVLHPSFSFPFSSMYTYQQGFLLLAPIIMSPVLLWSGCDTPSKNNTSFENLPPFAPIISLSPISPNTQESIKATLIFDPKDPDGDPVSLVYVWLKDGIEQPFNGDTIPASETQRGEQWTLRAHTFDGSLTSSVVSISTTIQNTPPTISSLDQTPENPRTQDDIAIENIHTSDVDGDNISLQCTWTQNGAPFPSRNNTFFVPYEYTNKGDRWEATITPHDNVEAGTPNVVSFIIENTPPKVLSVSITQQEAYENTILSASIEGFDEDDDALSFLYSWRVNGLAVATTETLDGNFFSRGNVIEIDVQAFDGTNTSDSLRSTPIIIQNTPPSLSSVSISPQIAYTTDTLYCSATAEPDADGDNTTITYEWFVNNNQVGTQAQLNSSSFQKEDSVMCSATIRDQADASILQDTITIQNTTPIIQSISLTNPASMLDVLYCEASSFDADGDTITHSYHWFAFGVLLNHSNSFLDPENPFLNLLPEDEIACSATPFDGDEYGNTFTSNTTTLLPSYISLSGFIFLHDTPVEGISVTTSSLPPTKTTTDEDGSYELSIPSLSNSSIFADVENSTEPSSFSVDLSNGTTQNQDVEVLDASFPTARDIFDPDNGYTDFASFASTMQSSSILVDNALQYRTLYPAGEEDWIRVSLSAQETYSFLTTFSHHTSNIIIFLYDAQGNQVATSSTYLGNDSLITAFTPSQTGDHFIKIDTQESNDVASYLLGVFRHIDQDNDGHISFYDCNDNDASIFPEATEIALDGIDQNCDGSDVIAPSSVDATESLGVQYFASINIQETHPSHPLYSQAQHYTLHSAADLDRFTLSVLAKSKNHLIVDTASTVSIDVLDGNTLLASYTSEEEIVLTNSSSITKNFSLYVRNNIVGSPTGYSIVAINYGTDNDLDGFYSHDTNALRDNNDANPSIHP